MVRGLFVVIVLSLGLAGCGPRTVFSSFFPLKYQAATEVVFVADGRATRQRVISACSIVDQTDSIAQGYGTTITGERHWLKRPDGSIWILPPLDPCRWRSEGPGRAEGPLPFAEIRTDRQSHALPRGDVYRLDRIDAPTLIEAYDLRALFDGGAGGVRASGTLGPARGETVTDTLAPAFPWLAAQEVDRTARRKAKEAARRSGASGSPDPAYFTGFSARAWRFENGAARCVAPEGARRFVEIAGGRDACLFENECRTGRPSDRPCKRALGALRPKIGSDYRSLHYSTAVPIEPGFLSSGVALRTLLSARAPGEWTPYRSNWAPQICLDGTCLAPDEFGMALFYHPVERVAVEIRRENYRPSTRARGY